MSESILVCQVCGTEAAGAEYCSHCANDLQADPPIAKSEYQTAQTKPKPSAAQNPGQEPIPVAENCPRSSCTGSVDDDTCMLCGLPARVWLRLPWEAERQPLTYGESTVFGRTTPPFAPHLRDFLNVSSKHCRLSLESSYLEVTDLGSLNGTYLDGVKLVPLEPRRINDRAELRLGRDNLAKRLSAVVIEIHQ